MLNILLGLIGKLIREIGLDSGLSLTKTGIKIWQFWTDLDSSSIYRLMLGRSGQDDFVLPLISWTEARGGVEQFNTVEVTMIFSLKDFQFKWCFFLQYSGFRDPSGNSFIRSRERSSRGLPKAYIGLTNCTKIPPLLSIFYFDAC